MKIQNIFFLIALICLGYNLTASNLTDSLSKLLPDAKGIKKAEIYNQLALEFLYNNPGKCIEYANAALKIANENKDYKTIINSYNLLGKSEVSSTNYSKALEYFNNAIELKDKAENSEEIAETYNGFGSVYVYTAQFEKAITQFNIALTIYQNNKNFDGVASMYNNIGIIYANLKKYSEALEYYQKSLAIHIQKNNQNRIASCYNNIGNIYLLLEDEEKALEYYFKSLDLKIILDDKRSLAGMYLNIGNVYENQSKYDLAIDNFKKTITIAEKLSNKQLLASAINNIANVYKSKKDYNTAIDYYKKGLEVALEIDSKISVLNDYKSLIEIYKALGNHEETSKYYELYSNLNDSLYNIETSSRINDLIKKYETENKQNEIELLKKDALIKQDDIEKQKIIIYAVSLLVLFVLLVALFIFYYLRNKETKTRTKLENELNNYMQKALSQQMNPHFIFNTLNSIQYYILQNDNLSSNKYLTKFARLMRLTLDNSQNNTIPVKDEIAALNLYLELESLRFEGKFEYKINVENEIEDYQIPTLLIQPFVENAIWHGLMHKEGNGLINVNLELLNNQIFCTIEDNGIGRKKAKEIKENKNNTHKSLGSKITENRLKLINSLFGSQMKIQYIDLEDMNGNASGTRVEIVIPIIN